MEKAQNLTSAHTKNPSTNNDLTNEVKSNSEASEKSSKRKERKPEIARYQPPSTRNTNKTVSDNIAGQSTSSLNSANLTENILNKQNAVVPVSQQQTPVFNDKQKIVHQKVNTRDESKNLDKNNNDNNNRTLTQEENKATMSHIEPKSINQSIPNKKLNQSSQRHLEKNESQLKKNSNQFSINKSSSSRTEPSTTTIEQNLSIDKNSNKNNLSKTIDHDIKSATPKSGSSGGLLKLNQNTLNEIIANHEKMTKIGQEYEQQPKSNLDSSQQFLGYHGNKSEYEMSRGVNIDDNNQKGQQYKRLYDPNNPSKPIFMPEKHLSNEKFFSKKDTSISLKKEDLNNLDSSKQLPLNKAEIIKTTSILQLIHPLEMKLKNLVDSFETVKSFNTFINDINAIRTQLEQLCTQAIFTHIETASNSNVDLNHWRSCYHQIIEILRKEYNAINSANQNNMRHNNPKQLKEQISRQLGLYLDEGFKFYTNLITNLENKYLKFSIDYFIDLNYYERLLNKHLNQSDTTIKNKDMKIALICINRCLISLGDLARYKEMIFNTSSSLLAASAENNNQINDSQNENIMIHQRDYSSARAFYLKAMAVAPKSSRSYHQLAILAVYTKRRLDTCYYYFRCSEVSSPLASVRQALNSLFEDARVRSDAIIKMISAAIINKKNKKLNSLLTTTGEQKQFKKTSSQNRVEIWYKPTFSNTNSNDKNNFLTKKTNILNLEEDIKENEQGLESNENSDASGSDTNDSNDTDNDSEDEDFGENDESENEDEDSTKNKPFLSDKFSLSCSNEKKLSVYELNKRFMLNYLNTIGKLFTKVGMESYPDVCSRMLHEFKELLRRKPNPFGKFRLLQITIINISLIDLTFKSSTDNVNNQSGIIRRSQQLECALSCALDMFVLISKRFSYLLKHSKFFESDDDLNEENNENYNPLNEIENKNNEYDEWRQMFPCIKIFIDWMLCNSSMWQPLPDQLSPDLGPNPDRWKIMSNMFNLVQKLYNKLQSILIKKIYSIDDPKINSEIFMDFLNKVKLEEDLEVAGFVPLLSLSPRVDYDYQNKFDTELFSSFLKSPNLNLSILELARMKKRSEKLCLFADFLCGLEQPVLKYDVLNKCYSPIISASQISSNNTNTFEFNRLNRLKNETNLNRTISTCSSSSVKSESDMINFESSLLNSMIKSNINDELTEVSNEQSTLNELKEKRRLLKAKMQEQQKREKSHQSLIDMNTQRRLELEIRPKFIVPDTNCFIDHLNLIDKILSTSYYIVVVPLLVINELDKLSKSIAHCNDDSIEHAEYVQFNAKQAIKYLNEKFDKRERNLKALTSQGSVLETIQFRSEEVRKQGTTDELILGCCLHYCRDNARDFMPNNKTDAIHLFREVVLLTEDRHLRLKAHTRNVPVKNIIQFCKWCNLYSMSKTLSTTNNNQILKNVPKSQHHQGNRKNKRKL